MTNVIVLVGRLTRDPELHYLPNGTPTTRITVAVNRPFKNQAGENEADFIEVRAWRKLAETVGNYLKKGRLVAVEGRLQSRRYEKDGQNRTAWEVVATNVRFLNSSRDSSSKDSGGDQYDVSPDNHAGDSAVPDTQSHEEPVPF